MARAASLALPRPRTTSTLVRVVTYTVTRGMALFCTTAVGIYLTILVANMGGYVDQIKRSEIREQVALTASLNEQIRRLPPEVRERVVAEMIRVEEQRLGLDRPFLVRSVAYLRDALLLRLGFAERMTSDTGSRLVRQILLDRLGPTLLLFATTQILLFFASVSAALSLSRRYGSLPDRLVIALAPLSTPPAWFYGIFLILIFAAWLRWLPFGGMVEAPPPEGKLAYAASVLRHMVLPVAAITLTSLPLAVYSWRTFFLLFSSEDYVELARAKGLPDALLERRYILRPALPTLLTSFALGLIGAWTGAIVLETVFNWPGLGRTLYQAVGLADTPVIVGATILYAYLLAITVFLLDVAYAIVDPRVRIGG